MKGYELIQKLVDELAHGSEAEFIKSVKLSTDYVAVTRANKTERLIGRTLRKIERTYKIRIIAHENEYEGWIPDSPIWMDVEKRAHRFKTELRAIVDEAESKINALLNEMKA